MLKPESVLGFVLFDIVIILVAARVMGGLLTRIGQPRVVGEIIAGVLLGPTLLGATVFTWSQPPSFLECDASIQAAPAGTQPSITTCLFPAQARGALGVIGQLALIFFMFLVGLELDFDLLKGKAKGIALVAFGAIAVPIGLAFVIGPLLYDAKWVATDPGGGLASQLAFTLFIAAMLTVTAFPVMARILQEKGLTQTAMGAIGVAAAGVVTVAMFLAVAVASGVATEAGAGNLALKFVAAGLYLAVMMVVVRPVMARLLAPYESATGLTPALFAVVIIMLFASAFAANKIGINVIVGGFMGGLVLPSRKRLFADLTARLAELTGVVLLPIFLAFSGLATDFTKLGASFLVGVAIFVVAGVVGKWAGSAVFARLGGLSWGEGNVLGVLMNCRGLLVLVVGLIGFQQNIISAPMQVAGVVMALVTTMMTGPLFDTFYQRLPAAEPAPDAEPELPPVPGGVRVLAGLDQIDEAPLVAHAAFAVVGGRRPAEVVLLRPFRIRARSEIVSNRNAEAAEAEQGLRALRLLGTLAPAGVETTPITFASTDPAEDYVRMAASRHCDVLVMAWPTGDGGGERRDTLRRVLDQAPCPVIIHSPGQLEGSAMAGGPVVVMGADGNGAGFDLAQRLGADGDAPTAVEAVEPAALVSASRGASAVVVVAESVPLGQPEWAEAVGAAGCPVYWVNPTLVSA